MTGPADQPFEDKLAAWQEWREAPWGRIRFAVVRETLRRQTEALGGGPLRILDVGGGDGGDAIPLAEAGHDVTVVDPTQGWLDATLRGAAETGVDVRALRGGVEDLDDLLRGEVPFDLVLFHFVTHYRPGDTDDLQRLASHVRPGGRLSVMAPNPATRVILRLTREGPRAALEELGREDMVSHTFATTTRPVSFDDVAGELDALGLDVVGRYAARVANDYVVDDSLKSDPDYFAGLLELELALCDQEPYVRMGGMWQLVAERRS